MARNHGAATPTATASQTNHPRQNGRIGARSYHRHANTGGMISTTATGPLVKSPHPAATADPTQHTHGRCDCPATSAAAKDAVTHNINNASNVNRRPK